MPNVLSCHHGQRRDSLVQGILTEIFQGRLRAGQRLVTQELADRFGVSATPVREAFVSLAGIGVIDLVPNRGALVRQVSQREVREVCQVRKALECEATRLACGRMGLGELHRLADELRKLQVAKRRRGTAFITRAREIDDRLHDGIAQSCGNAFLARELQRLKLLFRAFRDVAWLEAETRNDDLRLAEEAGEHLAIVEALIAGDRHGAARAMAEHIRSGAKYWSRALPRETDEPTNYSRI